MPPPCRLPAAMLQSARMLGRARAQWSRGRQMLTGVLTVLLMLLCLAPPAAADPAASPDTGAPPPERAEAVPGPVVLVGAPGLRWDDVSPELPALWSFVTQGAVGALSVRSVRTVACPVDGWLAVSAGRRAADVRPTVGCAPMWQPTSGSVGVWDRYLRQAEVSGFGARPGLLGEQLAAATVQVAAVGPGAAIATADAEGRLVGDYRRGGTAATLPADAAAALADRPELLVVDAGAIRELRTAEPVDPVDADELERAPLGPPRVEQVARLDALVDTVLQEAGPQATVILAGLADTGTSGPHLGLLGVRGPALDGTDHRGFLGSASTRQSGLAQTTDLTPTLLQLLGVPAPASLVGAPLRVVEEPPASPQQAYEQVSDLDAAAQAVRPLVTAFFRWLVYGQIAFYALAAFALVTPLGGPSGRRAVLPWLRRASVVLACVPVSTFLANLVPWWRAGNDALAVFGLTAAIALVLAAAALLGPWRRRPLGVLGAVAGVTAGVLAIDVVLGSRLQLSSIMGLQALVGGRFYGLGNQQFALLGVGFLLLAAALADEAQRRGRRPMAVGTVIVVGLVAVVVDGTPGLGSDFGGPPALIPAFTLLALMVAGVRLSLARLVLVGLATLGAVAALSILDWLRPAGERTHLGRFVETVLSGGAGEVIGRKLSQNLDIMFGSELSLLVPVMTIFVIAVLMRRAPWGPAPLQQTWRSAPALKHVLIAFLVMVGIGMAVNDSATVVPAIGGTLAVPLLIAVCVRARLRLDEQDPEQAELTGRE